MSKTLFIWFLAAMVFYFVGSYLSKLYSNIPSYFLFFSSVCIFILVSTCWMFAIKESKQLATLGTIWSISCLVIQVFIGVGLFGESISITKWIGIGVGTISVILLSI